MNRGRIYIIVCSVLLAANIIWAGSSSVAKWGLSGMDPLIIAFWRLLVAASIFTIYCFIRRGGFKFTRTELLRTSFAGFADAIYHWFWIVGLSYSYAVDASLLYVVEPIGGIFLAAIILREKLHRSAVAGLILVIIGVTVLSHEPSVVGAAPSTRAVGNIIMIAAMLCECMFSILLKPIAAKQPLSQIMAIAMWSAALLLLIPIALRGGVIMPHTLKDVAAIGYLSVFASVIGYALWIFAMRYLPLSIMTFSQFTNPILGPLVAWFFLGERIGADCIIGGTFLIGGMVFAVGGYCRIAKGKPAMEIAPV